MPAENFTHYQHDLRDLFSNLPEQVDLGGVAGVQGCVNASGPMGGSDFNVEWTGLGVRTVDDEEDVYL